jgi:hypothetical protein
MGKKIAVVGVGVVAGSLAVGPVLSMLNIERSEGFGLDDIVAAAVVALGVVMVDKLI